MEKSYQNTLPQNAVGMDDMVTAEFIPWKIDSEHATTKCRRHGRYGNRGIHSVEKSYQNTLPQNALGMTDMVTAEFIPWKNDPKRAITKCRRHDRYGNRGIHSVEKSYQNTLPQNALGMAHIVTAEFIPWKIISKYATK